MSTAGAAAPGYVLPGPEHVPGHVPGEGTGQRLMSIELTAEPTLTFEELFRRRYEPMVRVAYLLVGSRAEAEDVVQDAFARIEMRWSRLDGNIEGYLHRCVVNRSYDILRRRKLEQRFWFLQREQTADLEADELGDALATLPPKRRAAVVLRYYAGLPEKEIADALGVRPGTVKSMLHRALAQLREVIER